MLLEIEINQSGSFELFDTGTTDSTCQYGGPVQLLSSFWVANSGDAIDEISVDFFVYEFKEMNYRVDECPRCPRLM